MHNLYENALKHSTFYVTNKSMHFTSNTSNEGEIISSILRNFFGNLNVTLEHERKKI